MQRPLTAGFVLGAAAFLAVAGLWFAATSAPGWAAAIGTRLLERRGEEVYRAQCQSCHGGATGGRIDDYPAPHNANGHTWHHPDCSLRLAIREGQAVLPPAPAPDKPSMPAFKATLSDDDVAAVMAFIKSMWTPGQREVQAGFTREMCL